LEDVKIRSKGIAIVAALGLAVPAFALAGDRGPHNTPPGAAYGVMCERPPYDVPRDNADFSECVRALAKGVNGHESARDAARTACRQGEHNPGGQQFGKCVANTAKMIRGLRTLKAR
jgi:hypothetical protein